uniref:Uncharacterized protein n=1 Tax=Podoviridae sp. ct8Lf7 TaxID=2827723 RepID=A0A8S5S1J3_9CAUD|nr:MAG TPA: hypothetical protein [Podoviridae sp. ct8Lf7]
MYLYSIVSSIMNYTTILVITNIASFFPFINRII